MVYGLRNNYWDADQRHARGALRADDDRLPGQARLGGVQGPGAQRARGRAAAAHGHTHADPDATAAGGDAHSHARAAGHAHSHARAAGGHAHSHARAAGGHAHSTPEPPTATPTPTPELPTATPVPPSSTPTPAPTLTLKPKQRGRGATAQLSLVGRVAAAGGTAKVAVDVRRGGRRVQSETVRARRGHFELALRRRREGTRYVAVARLQGRPHVSSSIHFTF